MENNEIQTKSSLPSPIYILMSGLTLVAVNYILYLNNSVYFLLIILTPMAILVGLLGVISPRKLESQNVQVIISILGIIIGVTVFYLISV